ncbi:hypothetical protein PI124_g11686 [Phytophthora idaei]|nr:hypothetical protein PI124_g11686 [Phytophthora idaei]
MAVARSNSGLVPLAWVDNRAVYFLASQVGTEMTTVQRREKSGEQSAVPCPGIAAEYQRYMGGVNRHDQLRLQSYSMQLAARFPKFYKSLFLGLVDMAVVNAYIVHSHMWEERRKKKLSHNVFLARLHKQLIRQTETAFTQTTGASPAITVVPEQGVPVHGGYALVQTADTRVNNGVQRLRQRQCKVCTCYKPDGKRRGGH